MRSVSDSDLIILTFLNFLTIENGWNVQWLKSGDGGVKNNFLKSMKNVRHVGGKWAKSRKNMNFVNFCMSLLLLNFIPDWIKNQNSDMMTNLVIEIIPNNRLLLWPPGSVPFIFLRMNNVKDVQLFRRRSRLSNLVVDPVTHLS